MRRGEGVETQFARLYLAHISNMRMQGILVILKHIFVMYTLLHAIVMYPYNVYYVYLSSIDQSLVCCVPFLKSCIHFCIHQHFQIIYMYSFSLCKKACNYVHAALFIIENQVNLQGNINW